MFGARDAYLTPKIIVKWKHFTEAEVAGSDCSEDEIFSSRPEATREIFLSCFVDQKPLTFANVLKSVSSDSLDVQKSHYLERR